MEEDEGDIVDVVVDRVLEHKTIRDTFGRVAGSVDRAAQFIDLLAQGRLRRPSPPPSGGAGGGERSAGAGQRRTPNASNGKPSATGVGKMSKQEACAVLGFKMGTVMGREAIKSRQRELAKLFHPDKGGSDDAMCRVNEAVEVLLGKR
jgi:hypothetical protein